MRPHRMTRPAAALIMAISLPVSVAFSAQLVDLWSPRAGWQVLQDHAASPDLLVIGIIGERAPPRQPSFPVPLPPTGTRPPRSVGYGASGTGTVAGAADPAVMPRLSLRCENGVTSLHVERSLRPRYRRQPLGPGGRRTAQAGPAAEVEGKLVLDFGAGEPIEIDLRDYTHRAEPVLLPDPFATIGRLRRAETLYYYEIEAGDPVVIDFASKRSGAPADAVFPLAGLDDLLRAHRDPCGWRSS